MNKVWAKLADQTIDKEHPSFHFWNGINVWIERPHLINRKLLGNEILHTFVLRYSNYNHNLVASDEAIDHFLEDTFTGEDFHQHLNKLPLNENNCANREHGEEENKNFTVIFRKLIPRNSVKFQDVLEAVLKNEKENIVTFWPKRSDVLQSAITPNFPYRIKLWDNRIIIETYRSSFESSSTIQASDDWLKSSVLPKVVKWCCCSPTTSVLLSLNLISPKQYSLNYNYLKGKYGKKYVEMWQECSDPLKYVYEDISIAAYLMSLWEKERTDLNLSSKQTFVDLGCGNGLLVDILTSEGYVGIGIDVRKRKIWDSYEASTSLIEKAIEPSDYHIFLNYDWIIGNHSDELTPWIPVIAARSNYNMRVFLLPCCAYTFNGKYERCYQGKTQYQSYLSFIHLLCESMGFVVQEDKLRIPSTKRTCFICMSRNYKQEDEMQMDLLRTDFIKNHSRKTDHVPSVSNSNISNNSNSQKQDAIIRATTESENTNWISDFKPREKVEKVQNCSQLDRKFLDDTVLMVANMLLETENYISVQKGSEILLWNSGGKIKFADLIKLVDPSVLKCMKKQCGGFQTFLRNHRNVFQIIDGDVYLTVPVKGIPLNSKPARERKNRRAKEYSFKGKPCFFFFHHPQGCLLEESDCSFSHQAIEK